MKKGIALTLLSCLVFFFTKGQITKGSILLGGQISYQNNNFDYSGNQPDQKNNSAIFNISIGKAAQENNVYGLNLSYSPANFQNYYNGITFVSSKVNQYTFGVFNRRYKLLAKDFYFFTEFGLGYTYGKQSNTDTFGAELETIKQSTVQFYLTPGLSYKILNKLYLEILIPDIVTIRYMVSKDETPNQSTTQKSFVFNSSLNSTGGLSFLGVGFHFIF